ncbi:MAG: Rho GTPase activation protein [Benjaminiella poitrasii]|nr:MAG: Rho GTPase activation protein [Benjaminiella poitrasii]
MSTTTVDGAGSLIIDDEQTTKRHSRSLDLQSNERTAIPVRHQRSASESDGLEMKMAAEQQQKNMSPSVTIKHDSRHSSATPPSVFSIYKKKLSSPYRHRSLHTPSANNNIVGLPEIRSQISKSRASIGSAFTSLYQSSFNNSTTTRRFSTPVNNPDAAVAMHPLNQQKSIEEEDEGDIKKVPTYLLDQTGESKRSLPYSLQHEINQFAIDGFAKKYFATHKRGLFRRAVPMNELLCWTKDSIKQPLLLSNRDSCKDALKCFKTLQMLMNDRPRPRHFNFIEQLQSILSCGITRGQMRDEIYVQICRQLSKNPRIESTRKGWEILCVVCMTFPPSKNLESYLHHFVRQHHQNKNSQLVIQSHYVTAKLNRICTRGARGKVLSTAEIERAMEAPFKPSVFGESLDYIMELEKKKNCKDSSSLKIPRIVTFLTRAIYQLNGKASEGIFRVPGDADAVTELRIHIENGNYGSTDIEDPNVPASLLKYWLRDLADPLIPSDLYDSCIKHANDKEKAIDIINSLPDVNRRIALYMIRFLQDFTDPEVTKLTLMNVLNLAMVFAPNFLRCPSANLKTIFENSKYEQDFLKTLITSLDVNHEDCAYSEQKVLGRIKD